jgi:hypothetical protein
LKGKPRNYIPLETAIVEVQNKSGKTPAITTPCDTTHSSATRRQQSEFQFKPLLGSEPVEQSSMTAQQHACEEHFTYTIQQQMED